MSTLIGAEAVLSAAQMSQLDRSHHFDRVPATSGLPLSTDLSRPGLHVGKVRKGANNRSGIVSRRKFPDRLSRWRVFNDIDKLTRAVDLSLFVGDGHVFHSLS
jgi:hypothetical protein